MLRALAHIQSVVERRNTIPILSNVLLDVNDGHLSLTATDLEIALLETAEATVATPGAITAPAHTLYDIVRKLPDGAEVELDGTESDGRITLSAGRSRFALSSLPKDDFPVMAEGDLPASFELPAKELKRLIDKARFAISTEETRYYLNGIYLHAIDEALRNVVCVGGDPDRTSLLDNFAWGNCEKPENLGDLVADLRIEGPATLGRFNAGPSEQVWYFRSMETIRLWAVLMFGAGGAALAFLITSRQIAINWRARNRSERIIGYFLLAAAVILWLRNSMRLEPGWQDKSAPRFSDTGLFV